ncbi:MAG: hypothetical protein HQL67_04905 [Magnetococcales bacterium]|nr:hypothetical protein [Magnetococcales bacterium]
MVANKSQEILDDALTRLQGIWRSPIPLARFELEIVRLERVIKEFRRHEPVRAFYLLGLASTLRDDRESMRVHFNNALAHSGNDADVRHGFAACLSRLGFYAEARKQYEILYNDDQEDLGVLAELIISSLASGRIQDGVKWIGHWSQINPDRPFEEAETIAKSGALLEKFGISDDHVERLQSLAMNILEKECKEIKTINYRGVPEEDPEWIDANLVLDDSEEEVERLNNQLNHLMACTPTPDRLAELLVFNFTKDEAAAI